MRAQTKVIILFSATMMSVDAQTELHEQVVFSEHVSSNHVTFASSRKYDIAEVKIHNYLTPTKLKIIVPPTIGKETIKLAPQAFSWMNVPNTEVILEFGQDGNKFRKSPQIDWAEMFAYSTSLVVVDFGAFCHKPLIKNMTGMFRG